MIQAACELGLEPAHALFLLEGEEGASAEEGYIPLPVTGHFERIAGERSRTTAIGPAPLPMSSLAALDRYDFNIVRTAIEGSGSGDTFPGCGLGGTLLLLRGDVRTALQQWAVAEKAYTTLQRSVLATR